MTGKCILANFVLQKVSRKALYTSAEVRLVFIGIVVQLGLAGSALATLVCPSILKQLH